MFKRFLVMKIISLCQWLLGLISFIGGIACGVNIVLIAFRPETISVINSFIGLGVMMIALIALSRVLFFSGLRRWRGSR